MPDAITIYTICIYTSIIVLVTIMAYHMGHLRGQVVAMRKELDHECDHTFMVYSTKPVLSSCSICGTQHPWNEYEEL